MGAITASEIKIHGVASIEAVLKEQSEATISVRGKDRYVVMDIDTFNRFREFELEAALYQARQEIRDGRGFEESVDDHLKRIQALDP